MALTGNRGFVGKATIAVIVAGSAYVALAGAALADVKAGVDAWTAGDFTTAANEWQGPAAQGDPDAQFNLAQAYKLGRGVPRDVMKAEDLYRRAAQQGHTQAADNYGLMLFQRGEHGQAMPYIRAAADRGDARSQYIYGLALFNGDSIPKDWVRAYAYESLAQQAGLAQASGALAQMDQHIAIADRQRAVSEAARIAGEAQGTRERQLAAADLGAGPVTSRGGKHPAASVSSASVSSVSDSSASVERAVDDAVRAAGSSSPATAGADYTLAGRPMPKPVPSRSAEAAKPAPGHAFTQIASTRVQAAKPSSKPAAAMAAAASTTTPRRTATPAASGPWRIQLGAFGVPGNAEALWGRVKGRSELAGHPRLLIPTGKVTRLLAGGFASSQAASAACSRLSAAGFTCLPTRD